MYRGDRKNLVVEECGAFRARPGAMFGNLRWFGKRGEANPDYARRDETKALRCARMILDIKYLLAGRASFTVQE